MARGAGALLHPSMKRPTLPAATAWALLSLGLGGLLPGSASSAADPMAAAPAQACSPDPDDHRRDLVAWVNQRRAADGLEPLRIHPELCRIAQRRAEEMAAAGSVQSSDRAIQRVSRALLAEGYEAHRWTERAILGYDVPARMAERWGAGANLQDTVLGPFEEVGVGVAPADDGVVVALLFAEPRLSELVRVTEPLADLAEVRAEALARVNAARRESGRAPVVANPRLDDAAQRYAELMLARGFYAHESREGGNPKTRVEAAGYGQFTFLGENIAQGLFTPAEVVERWLESPGHRRNVLDARAAETGLGVAYGDTPRGFRVLWVQLFGSLR